MASVGQPTKYNEKRVNIILEALSNLSGKVAAAKSAGVDFATYKTWYDKYPEFKEQVDRVEEEAMDKGKSIAVQAIFAQMGKNWTAAAWWLERNYPNQYGKRERFDGNITHEVKQLNINVPDEETKKLMTWHIKTIQDAETTEFMKEIKDVTIGEVFKEQKEIDQEVDIEPVEELQPIKEPKPVKPKVKTEPKPNSKVKEDLSSKYPNLKQYRKKSD